MSLSLPQLSFRDLTALQNQIQNEMDKREKEVRDDFGNCFVNQIGVRLLAEVPKVEASQVGLVNIEGVEYPSEAFQYNAASSAVRGIMGIQHPRPFLAMKIEILNQGQQKIAKVAELVFQRYSEEQDNYVTLTSAKILAGEASLPSPAPSSSFLYTSGGMNQKQLEAIGSLLEGKTVSSPTQPNYLIRLAE